MTFRQVFLFALICSIPLGCTVNPVTGKKDLTLMSEAQEKAIGASSDPQIVAAYGLYENEELMELVDSIGDAIVEICHRPNLGYTYRLLNSPVVNAFAVPGGYVYLTRGILAHFNSEAELAGVFGHEIGHITARHSARQQTTQLLTQVGLITGTMLSDEFAQLSDYFSQGASLLLLSYSRAHESESDELGVEYSMSIGYDAHQMADFFNTLKKLSTPEDGEPLPEFYSTHPDPGNRFVRVHELADAFEQRRPGNYKIGRNAYLKRINGIIYGQDPRDGFIENGMLYIPKADIQLKTPGDWRYQITADVAQWISPEQDAFVMFGLDKVDSPREGLDEFIESAQLTIQEENEVKINGWPGIEFIAGQAAEDPNKNLMISGVLFEKNNKVYYHIGFTYASEYERFRNNFKQARNSIVSIESEEIRQVKPDRIKILAIDTEATLRGVLDQTGQDPDQYKEIALLNNIELDDAIQPGTLIKVIGK